MENNIKRLRTLRQELVTTTGAGLKFGKHDIKDAKDILDEMDSILDEMENNLTDFIDDDFKKATAPAIRFLFKNHDPHTKIYIDYSSAELLQGQRCCNLNNEIPD